HTSEITGYISKYGAVTDYVVKHQKTAWERLIIVNEITNHTILMTVPNIIPIIHWAVCYNGNIILDSHVSKHEANGRTYLLPASGKTHLHTLHYHKAEIQEVFLTLPKVTGTVWNLYTNVLPSP